MDEIKSEIKKAILESGGYPNFTKREYLDAIRLAAFNRLSSKQIDYARDKNVDFDALIMKITADVTKNLF